jgi:iron complex outermembrane receptor protein
MRSQAGVRPGRCRPDVTTPRLIRMWSSPARWAALAALIIAPASAQVPDSATRLPDLKVTVTRTASPLSTLGAAVTVIDSAAVHRERIATGLDEALAFVPGIVVQNRWNYSLDERLSIRGFGARANFGLRGVKVLLDGVPQTLPDGQSQLNNLDLSLVSRVEVLRGGASALYGNASGGVVSFITNAVPAQPWLISARAEGGTFGTAKEELVTGARLGSLGGTMASSRFSTDGFRQQSGAEQRRMSLAVDWNALAHTTVTLRFGSADDPHARNPGALTAAELAANPDSAAAANIRRGADKAVSQTQLALGFRHDGGRVRIDASLYGLQRGLDNPLATPPPAPASANEGTWVGIDRLVGGGRASVTADLNGPSITAGIDDQALRDDRTNKRSVNGVATDTLLLDQREQVSERAAFAQLAWPLGSRVTLRGGVRRDNNRFAVIDHLLSDGDASGTRTMSATSGNGGISLRVNRLVIGWVNAATVFETPTTTELANRPDGSGGFNPGLNPQRSVSVEAGVRGSAGPLSFDMAAYSTHTRDAIVPYNEVGGRTYYRNAGSTRTLGAEAALSWRLRPGLVALATGTLTDAIFADYRVVNPASIDTLDGRRIAGLPRGVARIGLQGSLGHHLSIDIDQAFSAAMFGDDDNTIRIDGWGSGVTGVRLAWHGRTGGAACDPFIAGMNVFNRRYVGSVSTNGAGGRVFEPSAGRTIYAGLSLTAAGK